MATITASGVGSGLDIESIISKLMTLERQPITSLETKKSAYESKISAFGQVKSALSSLQTTIAALQKTASFTATKASVADSSALAAVSSTGATAGNYSIEIGQLAKAQRVTTSTTSEPTVAAGNLTITLGTLSGGSFTADAARTTTVTLSSGSTLEDLRNAINDADGGVTARIINNGTIDQLVLASDDTGADQAFQISGSGGLAGFNYDPATDSGSLSSVQTAQDAALTVDGIAVTRSTNTISDLIDGVTLTLKSETATATSINVESDNTVAQKAIEAFVSAYNNAVTTMRSLTSFDPSTKKAGSLNGESGIGNILSQLRNTLGSSLSGVTGANSLASIGLSFGLNGALSIDTAKLTAALADPTQNVAELFGGNGTVSGYADLLNSKLTDLLSSGGSLASRTDALNGSIDSYGDRIDALELRMDSIEKRYRAQFAALDAMMSSMSQTSTFLTQQLTAPS
jgi:flagellar hook-associated protein 2